MLNFSFEGIAPVGTYLLYGGAVSQPVTSSRGEAIEGAWVPQPPNIKLVGKFAVQVFFQ